MAGTARAQSTPDAAVAANLRATALQLAAGVAAIGGFALLGWLLSVDDLKSVVPGQVTMKANTAICLILAAGSLGSLSRPLRSMTRRAGAVAALTVAAVGLVTLAEYVFGLDLGLDQLLFHEPEGALGTAQPGRMAINTAVAFSLFGAAVLLFDRRRCPAPAAAVAMGLLSVLSLFGYVTGVTSFYGLKGVTQMAIPTAVAVLGLAAGLLLARPERGFVAALSRSTPGAELARRLLPAGIGAPIVLGMLRLEGEKAGLFGAATGTFLFASVFMLAAVALVLRNAALLDRADADRREAMGQLALARDVALEASRMKSQFLANMSHEIRTPLNGVIGMTELLLDTSLDSEQREYARTAQSSGESLLGVINDILDFSKIEAGRLELEEAQFDLPDVVDDVCDLVANRAHAKGLELASDIREGVPRLVLGDQTRLRQVLTNLLSNAIKFTSEGEVISIVSSTSREGDHAAVRFEVQDTGIGIDPGKLDRLFESFSQADASTTRRFGGTGLGLAISKQLVELMGGEIGAENRPEGGSAFWFRIPFATVAESREEERPAPDVGGLRLLVVDDNATNRTMVTRLATSWGMAPEAAESGHEALEMLRSATEAGTPYEVAVLDLMMPGMDGIELARRITEDPRLRAVRMVMLASGLASRRDAEAVGIAVYLTKPARRSLLYNAVVTAAAAPELGDEASAQPAPAPAPLRAAILVVEDNPVNQAVAEGMLTRRGHPVDIARNGREALEALACGTYGAVLMDCQMPEMDGYEATAEIRRREANGRRIPIIAMTAHSMKGDRERCLAAGMDDHLPKPVRGEALDAALARWVAPPNGDTLAKRGASPQANGNGPIDLETLERLQAEFGGLGRADALDSVLRQFLETTPGRVAAIIDAVDRGSDEDVNQEAHALRGASSNFGATQLAGVCSALERSGCDGDLEQARALIPNLEEAATSTRAALHQWIAAPGSPQPVDAGR